MARRMNTRNADAVRQRIQTVHLVKRLQDHALGECDMTKTQVQAASFLINKVMPNPPDRKELSGPDGGAIPVGMRLTFVEPGA